jgi:hypothetical protein
METGAPSAINPGRAAERKANYAVNPGNRVE